jgi:hypothetical protein
LILRTPLAARIALVITLLAGVFALTADAASAATVVPAEAATRDLGFAEIVETCVVNWLTGKPISMPA